MSKTRFVDPDDLTSNQRQSEIAAIFAQGCRRLADTAQILAESDENSPDPPPTCLDRAGDHALMDPRVNGTRERRADPCP